MSWGHLLRWVANVRDVVGYPFACSISFMLLILPSCKRIEGPKSDPSLWDPSWRSISWGLGCFPIVCFGAQLLCHLVYKRANEILQNLGLVKVHLNRRNQIAADFFVNIGVTWSIVLPHLLCVFPEAQCMLYSPTFRIKNSTNKYHTLMLTAPFCISGFGVG